MGKVRKTWSAGIVFAALVCAVCATFAQGAEGSGNSTDDRLTEVERKVDLLLSPEGDAKKSSPTAFEAYWDKGIRLKSTDGNFKLKIGGRIQADWAWISEDANVEAAIGKQQDGTEFRRARLYFSGDIYENVFFKTQFDFAGGDADFKDVYVGVKGVPVVGHIRVGHFKEPFSLEELTSSKYITFMERSLPNVFAPSRNSGVAIYNAELDKRMTWAVGLFRDTDGYGDSDDNSTSASVRVTGLPWYAEKGKRLAHVGVAYNLQTPDDTVRFRSRPEMHFSDRFVDTGSFAADRVGKLGLEGALVYGPFSVQSEYILADVDSVATGDPGFSAFYVYAGYFLTGEHRKYKNSAGTFSRVKPKRNFGKDGGPGAWEVAVRYSMLDLNDAAVSGGKLEDVTAGVNWYLNPNARFMLNYVLADLEGVGDAEALMMRFQIDF